jgi:glycosyltransferase involved in cell wall biosynthesis
VSENKGKVLFVYWGRRGSLSWIAVEIARHLHDRPELASFVSYSTENELAGELAALRPTTWPFTTFTRSFGAFTRFLRFRRQCHALLRRLRREGIQAVVVLMSHVWTPLLGRRLARESIRYVVVAHDASRHPGDRTGRVQNWLLRDLSYADRIVTLSRAVANRLTTERGVAAEKIVTVPHPIIAYGSTPAPRGEGPLRVVFLGRIMAYKGLGLLVTATELLRQRGVAVSLGVYGEGSIAGLESRLAALDAKVVNRWIEHEEIGPILAEYDVLVLPYVEASQSGVAAAAQGVGIPIVATPVGGLVEQVRDDIDGLIAEDVSAEALANCLERLAADPALLERLSAAAGDGKTTISIGAFAERLRGIALEEPSKTDGT